MFKVLSSLPTARDMHLFTSFGLSAQHILKHRVARAKSSAMPASTAATPCRCRQARYVAIGRALLPTVDVLSCRRSQKHARHKYHITYHLQCSATIGAISHDGEGAADNAHARENSRKCAIHYA